MQYDWLLRFWNPWQLVNPCDSFHCRLCYLCNQSNIHILPSRPVNSKARIIFVAFLQNPPDARCSDIWFQSFDWSIDAVVVENSIPRTTLRFLLASLAAVGRLGETASFFFLWNIWGIISVPYTNPRGNRFAPISKAISRETGQASNPSHHTCIRLSSVQDETAHRKNYFCLKTSWDCDPS